MRNRLLESVSELILESSQGVEEVLASLPTSHRQFERIYLRDTIYRGRHADAVDGLTVKPAVPDRVYRLYYPNPRRLIGWADYSGKNGTLTIRRKGEWTEPRTSIPDDRRSELEAYVRGLTEGETGEVVYHGGNIEGDIETPLYVTSDAEAAKAYATEPGSRVWELRLNSGKHLDLDDITDLRGIIPRSLYQEVSDNYQRPFEALDDDDVREALTSAGYDTVSFEDVWPGSDGSKMHQATIVLNPAIVSLAVSEGFMNLFAGHPKPSWDTPVGAAEVLIKRAKRQGEENPLVAAYHKAVTKAFPYIAGGRAKTERGRFWNRVLQILINRAKQAGVVLEEVGG